ncbi:MAG: anthranilate phosphoribosyltransferase [Gammaproteobacteria bacterium]|jgi:anthranilate phosphoribosyltransferase|nr:anthranilate phosphoribosyltransferase [Gammaproteobacteria bacterium]MBT4607794.1 anthranilate phosphoribosyltransferase [Thiotrichales bacterium]MBT3473643.1 anthranilate phosphoribosyltransferase [Gammaproteobacteria bacterium]MBT3966280.1 anthranilate phosphoribosyltransferase [Gammaproteobacteria bacterium]MBT4081703.1 anthranilate phosphoribosyltransferase [Gammaproteobacteria bacterium]
MSVKTSEKALDPTYAQEVMTSIIQRIATGPTLSKNIEFEEARTGMRAILEGHVPDVQAAVFLIALRMKRETDEENRGILSGMQDLTETVIADVDEVVDIVDPYNGYNRTLPAAPFLAPLLAELGVPAISQGLETVSPKYGFTHRQILRAAGVNVDLSVGDVAAQLSDPAKGWGYLDQTQSCPALHRLIPLRNQLIKRSVLTTTEVSTRPIRGKSKTHQMTGYVHKPYAEIYAMLARHGGFDSALLVRGVEGGVTASLRQLSTTYQFMGDQPEVAIEIDPESLGIQHELRAPAIPDGVEGNEEISKRAAEAGIKALEGEEGITFDALLLSATMALHHLGRCETLAQGAEQVRDVLSSGRAAGRI